MDRRDALKSLLLTPLTGGLLASSGCATNGVPAKNIRWTRLPATYSYGRTTAEINHDKALLQETFFREHELLTIAVLCDIILPTNNLNGGALDAGLPDFVEFMVKERRRYQNPIRGGIMWLDGYAIDRYDVDFVSVTEAARLEICDAIAYPDVREPALQPGIAFFSLMRDLTLTGYYTTALGFADLSYQGNTPNIWDGVPDTVLRKHKLDYEAQWLQKCVDQSRRDIPAQWDEDMNLTS